ncbi:hypothetical protein BpHYR1_029543 [Brachionus plicatilis]|uniref:TIR domain-containing protein n=1 Tax=Brachionus plicatilis TaxID=10195 RepID=A0A3M7R7L8_BRAPC|nr:hypothetical protein BpHYR1_029543 [Brachionus plicatilis]
MENKEADANAIIIESIDFLSNYKIDDILRDDEALKTLFRIKQFIYFFTAYKISMKKKIHLLLSNILLKIHQNKSDIDPISIVDINSIKNQSDRNITIIYLCLSIINFIYCNSVKFSQKFVKHNGLKALALLLKDNVLFSKTHTIKIIEIEQIDLIDDLVRSLYNLSETSENNSKVWYDQDIVSVLLKLATLKPSAKLDAFLTITEIASDKEIESMEELHQIVDYLQNQLVKVSEQFDQNKINRCMRQKIQDNCAKQVEIHCILDNTILTSIDVYIRGLFKLAVNDKLRQKIYFGKNFSKILFNILSKGNAYESQCCLKVYTQLSFDPEIASFLENDQQFIDYLKERMKQKESAAKMCEQILWNMKKNMKREAKIKCDHVMISYNSASRHLCLRIKKQLEQMGLQVWIDVERIHGSSLDSMAKAVEMSFCVLICITEKYRLSEFCQAEATYAFRLGKPIIPLIMQKGYENVQGWLGIIQKDKMNVNFIKYSFEECIKRLKHELDSLVTVSVENGPKNGSGSMEKCSIETWDRAKVKEWFDLNQINMLILDKINISDGAILQQLYEMRRDAPEFYFQLLNSNQIDAHSMLKFTFCLKKLIELK